MDRAFAAGASGSAPTAPTSPSIGYPTAGNPATGTQATKPGAWWYHAITEELRNIIVAGGITPDHADLSQVKAALDLLYQPIGMISQQPGGVSWFAMAAAPAGFLKANGAAISRTAYADLFAAIGTTFGAGDGSTTFNVPDLRGEFVRGWDDARGVDAARAFGSAQAGMSQINAGVAVKAATFGIADGPIDQTGVSSSVGAMDLSIAPWGTSATAYPETRPRNIALLACIKYRFVEL